MSTTQTLTKPPEYWQLHDPGLFLEPPSRWRQSGLLMQWQLRRNAQMAPMYITVQLLLAIATVLGYGLLIGEPDRVASLYLTTGGPTISLVMVGLVMTPQWVAQARTEGSLAWMRTLPVPRPLFLVADLAVWTMMALPGLVVGLLVGAARFHVGLSISWPLIPGVLLVALTSSAIGYAIANLFAPSLAQVLSQVFVFVIMLFTPISFPASRMPDWAEQIHHWLPFEPMAQVVRSGLASADFTTPGRAWAVLSGWCLVSVAAAAWALGRRQ
ncbi:ABC-2 type transport system permease protein [Propionibacterium cyclohexanicum]|uniref:ABC-2 type transport system permease protein n=1 Tax=Propionibacterium cyclohexanicum TaxID=64702 RepID=A0A1H9RZJ1_9ACTN|nr:ABC transporter permease [Propionibacterium cyclohexanicum]SER78104.1 ABC-2 type transport system permease protein [Propionibacterium cyclohexanicum]